MPRRAGARRALMPVLGRPRAARADRLYRMAAPAATRAVRFCFGAPASARAMKDEPKWRAHDSRSKRTRLGVETSVQPLGAAPGGLRSPAHRPHHLRMRSSPASPGSRSRSVA